MAGNNAWRRSSYTRLKNLLKDADENVKKAAIDELNKASEKLVSKMKSNMRAQGIRVRTGKLISSFEIKKATVTPLMPKCIIYSEVYKPLPKRVQAWRNLWESSTNKQRNTLRRFKGRPSKYRYPAQGVPYGRIIEFSPRINKPFFYKAWYEEQKAVRESIILAIGMAWSKS